MNAAAMKIYNLSDKDNSLMMLDIFQLIGLQDLPDEEKAKYLDQMTQLIIEYFLGEKIQTQLTEAQLEALMKKYPMDSEENAQALMEELMESMPDSAELYVQAMLEIKAQLITSHYTTKLQAVSELAEEEKDPKKKEFYQTEAAKFQKNLEYIQEGNWALILTNTN